METQTLEFEEHEIIRDLIKDKMQQHAMHKVNISEKTGLGKYGLLRYLSGYIRLKKDVVCKVLNCLNIAYPDFLKKKEIEENDTFYIIKVYDTYYKSKEKRRYFNFGWKSVTVHVYTSRYYEAKRFTDLQTARRFAKKLNGLVVKLKERGGKTYVTSI